MLQERIEAVMQKATEQVAFKLKISKFHDFNCLSNFHSLRKAL